MMWGTSKTSHQSWRRNRRRVCDSAHYTEQVENFLSDFDKEFQDTALLEPVAAFKCYSILLGKLLMLIH